MEIRTMRENYNDEDNLDPNDLNNYPEEEVRRAFD